jgi:hypothetical protein
MREAKTSASTQLQETGEWVNTLRAEWENHVSRMELVRFVQTVRITSLIERVLEFRVKDGEIHMLDKRVP